MEQISGKSPVLRESVMELYIEQKVDHENRPHFSLQQHYQVLNQVLLTPLNLLLILSL